MSSRECAALAPLRSAWVEGRLPAQAADRLMQHLATCPACAQEVRELRRIRDLLNHTPTDDLPPRELTERLVRIAGVQARDPLWTRPFRRTRPGGLPNHRRQQHRRLAGVAGSAVVLVTAAAGVGYLAAPASDVVALPDPSTSNRAEFAASITELPLDDDALATVAMAHSTALGTAGPIEAAPGPTRGDDLDEDAALRLLDQAASAGTRVDYQGTQQVLVAVPGGHLDASVAVNFVADEGSDATVRTPAGAVVTSSWTPVPATVRATLPASVLTSLADNFELSGQTGARVLGRPAAVILARTPAGRLVARWWIDQDDGLVLQREVYGDGVVQVAVRFTSLTLQSSPPDHRPARIAIPQTTASMVLDSADTLSADGWPCPRLLAGLSLIRLRGDDPAVPSVVHLLYTDGVHTLSVIARRGRLGGPPEGTVWDARLGAYLSTGFPTTATWQSGDLVISAISDNSPGLVPAVVSTLPHDPLPRPTLTARILDGWSHLRSLVS